MAYERIVCTILSGQKYGYADDNLSVRRKLYQVLLLNYGKNQKEHPYKKPHLDPAKQTQMASGRHR